MKIMEEFMVDSYSFASPIMNAHENAYKWGDGDESTFLWWALSNV